MKGKLNDGMNTISRYSFTLVKSNDLCSYVVNNFYDRLRQISIDIFLGNLDLTTASADHLALSTEGGPMIWKEEHFVAINTCTSLLLSEHEDEAFVNAWIVISINQRGQEQERILLLTQTAFYRCKYNFQEARIVRFTSKLTEMFLRLDTNLILIRNGTLVASRYF